MQTLGQLSRKPAGQQRAKDLITQHAQQDPKHLTNLLTSEWLLHAADRNHGNYGFSNDTGKLIPLDYGESFHPLPWAKVGNHPSEDEHYRHRKVDIDKNELFKLADANGVLKRDTSLNPEFIDKILAKEGEIRNTFANNVKPHLGQDSVVIGNAPADKAEDLLDSKLAFLKDARQRIANGENMTLDHLPRYKGANHV